LPRALDLPYRQIHLDFHTSGAIRDVGAEFDPREFARTMKEANVNSVTVFAKCHHGLLYYNTRRPERHPGLKRGLDLLGEQIEALHREGIRAPIYVSLQVDEYAAQTHPEWVARRPDGTLVGPKPLGNPYPWFTWHVMDMSSPYQEYLAEQVREILKLYHPVDGMFFDMCWDQPSCSKWAIDAMRKAGLNPELEADRLRHAAEVSRQYMARFHKMVRSASRGATVYFNSRPLHLLRRDIPYLEQVEIEALATGGWGYMYFPINVRYARNFGKPYMAMTARFHKGWSDFGGLKPQIALEYEMLQGLAHGARCSIGDQLHPRGRLDKAAYETIGQVYAKVKAAEPYVQGATPLSQIGVFLLPPEQTNTNSRFHRTAEGYTRMLQQLQHQFEIVDAESNFEKFELLILPDALRLDAALVRRIRSYLKKGGKLLATGSSGLSEDGKSLLLPELGIKPAGESPFSTTYIRFGRGADRDVPKTDHVMYERGMRVVPQRGTTVLATVVEPYFERTWEHFSGHAQTPPDKASRYAAAVIRGRTAYIAYPVFAAYAEHGNIPYRLLVRNILDRLIDQPLVRVEGPTALETTLMRQKRRTVLHVLHYLPQRRAQQLDIVEDVIPLRDVAVSVKLPARPKNVRLAPQGDRLSFGYEEGRVTFVIPEVRGHQMVAME